MKKKILIFLVGETGCGKDTVANKLPYPKVVSYKTGPMRNTDIEGVTHKFITDCQMDELEQRYELIAWTRTGDTRYCATSDQLEDVSIYIINPDGIRWFKNNYKKDDLKTIVVGLYLPLDIRRARCRTRSDFDTVFENRVSAEQEDYNNFRLNGEFDYLIYNYESSLSASIISSIINMSIEYDSLVKI